MVFLLLLFAYLIIRWRLCNENVKTLIAYTSKFYMLKYHIPVIPLKDNNNSILENEVVWNWERFLYIETNACFNRRCDLRCWRTCIQRGQIRTTWWRHYSCISWENMQQQPIILLIIKNCHFYYFFLKCEDHKSSLC